MLRELKQENIQIAGVNYCIHSNDDNCSCRKPKTGLIDLVIARLKIEDLGFRLQHGYLIGDTIRDIETGKAAGLATILVFSGKEKPGNRGNWQVLPDFTASDLFEAADMLIKKS
jgi:D-glycero-D-manno-heptose 1,7-bisphosphate phosphatase